MATLPLLNLDQIFGAEAPAIPAPTPEPPVQAEDSLAGANIATRDVLALWLHVLRSDGASISFNHDAPTIDWPAHLDTPDRRRDWAANLSVITQILEQQAAPTGHHPPSAELGRRLIGCGFPPRQSQTPPESILATPRVMCPRCGQKTVLAELRAITGGTCWPCWEARTGVQSC